MPFVSKCIGVSLAKVAARCMAGKTLAEQGFEDEIIPDWYNVKEAVFPFNKFPGVDPILGPEMKSTGEVMGVGNTFAEAYGKAQRGASNEIPSKGVAFLSVRERDKAGIADLARDLVDVGFKLVATRGTAQRIAEANIPVDSINKVLEGRPHIVDLIKNDGIDLIINTTEGRQAIADSSTIRSSAQSRGVYYSTTLEGGRVACMALHAEKELRVRCLQEMHRSLL